MYELFANEFAQGAAAAVVAGFFAALNKDNLLRLLAFVFDTGRWGRRIQGRQWHTVFVQQGKAKTESIDVRAVPWSRQYFGTITYPRTPPRQYRFSGRLAEGLFTGSYLSADPNILDTGTWTLKLNDEGTALVGAYVWMVDEDRRVGHDFYQWTHLPFLDLLENRDSEIDGSGVFAATDLPRGALVGEFRGEVVDNPTRESLTIKGRSVHPSSDCRLRRLNHSCVPNAYFDGGLLFLLKDITAHTEEITIDYRATEPRMRHPFRCKCPTCNGTQSPAMIGEA